MLRHFTLDEVLIVALYVMASAGLLLLVCTAFSIGGIWGVWIPLFLYITSLGAVLPNAGASAMAAEAHRAGSAAALIGTLQFGLGAVTSGLVGLLAASPALGMGMIVAACGLAGLVARLVLVR